MKQLLESCDTLAEFPFQYRGKVRDTWDLGEHLLIVSSDRVSAFDVVLPTLIPEKGVLLNQLSAFWFRQLDGLGPTHFISADLNDFPKSLSPFADLLTGRSMVVRKAERIDFECVVRGYLAGSAWQEYLRDQTVAGIKLPAGMAKGEQLPEPVFTPAAKFDMGHDLNISVADLESKVGSDLAAALQIRSLALYDAASVYARQRGLILADTKFEFGFTEDGLTLIDELLTPDSSRYWRADSLASPDLVSLDKQHLRDWLIQNEWNREAPGPELPESLKVAIHEKYEEVFIRLTREVAVPV